MIREKSVTFAIVSGIYVHIPFCKSRCLYCGFYSTTRHELVQRYVDAVCREMVLRRSYLTEPVQTVYIGGGTPSLLTEGQLEQLFSSLLATFPDADLANGEVTIECNPDDVTPSFATALSRLPVNRVSMGAQTFSDKRLRFIGRRHNAQQISEAVTHLRNAGIGNVSIDLMFGFPGETADDWHDDLVKALALDVEHLSAYALMFEEGTPLYRMMERGEVNETDEELSRQMYYDLCDRLEATGYEHYEISNFARLGPQAPKTAASVPVVPEVPAVPVAPEVPVVPASPASPFRSRHNSSYWNGTPYLGLGAAAHSYDRKSRQWNVADVERYIEGVRAGDTMTWIEDREVLDATTRYNDTVMTALRTKDGLALQLLTPPQRAYCLKNADRHLAAGLLTNERDRLRLSRDGLFVSDMVMADLMMA